MQSRVAPQLVKLLGSDKSSGNLSHDTLRMVSKHKITPVPIQPPIRGKSKIHPGQMPPGQPMHMPPAGYYRPNNALSLPDTMGGNPFAPSPASASSMAPGVEIIPGGLGLPPPPPPPPPGWKPPKKKRKNPQGVSQRHVRRASNSSLSPSEKPKGSSSRTPSCVESG